MQLPCINIYKFVIFFSISLPAIGFSQTLDVVVVDSLGNEITPAIISISTLSDSLHIKEYFNLSDGRRKLRLAKTYDDDLYITARSFSYFPGSAIIRNPLRDSTYFVKIRLQLKPPVLLDDIVVTPKKPYEIKKDTVSYDVKSYLDGSERKIQDVIKKLPGIEVNEQSGEIKYKGKSIETVTLDGDNLFGYNYTLATRNINADMVEEVEAIDNYTENPLLKGIEQGGKVSLNLKLKKRQFDISGNFDLGGGWFDNKKPALDLHSNILGIAQAYKSFAVLGYNNVGVNNSPFDYFGFIRSLEQVREQDYFAEKIIPETRLTNLLDGKRTNINSQLFANYNAVFKLNPKLSIKTNLYFLQDKITSNQLFENRFEINNDRFTTSDSLMIFKKPLQYRGDMEIKYQTSTTSLLEYRLRVRQENIETPMNIIQNQTNTFNTLLQTGDFYLKQDLLWTKRLSGKHALQTSLFYSHNIIPQTFVISPSLFDVNSMNDTQESRFGKTFFEGKATYLGSGQRDKYSFVAGVNIASSPYLSRLYNQSGSISQNNLNYLKSNIFNSGVYNLNREKWQISISYTLRYLGQTLTQNIEDQQLSQNNVIFEPALKVKYKLYARTFLTAYSGYSRNTNAAQYFFLNQVLIDNRTTVANIPSLELQNSQRYGLTFFNNNLYKQFQLRANIVYRKSTGNFFANSFITENTTRIEYFFLPQDNSNWSASFLISKYIPIIASTLRITSNYSVSDYRNIVNNSELRQNRSQFNTNTLFWKTALDIPVNFENTLTYQYSYSRSAGQPSFVNIAWQNNFKIIVKPHPAWFLLLSSFYYLPNSDNKTEDYMFLDATLRYRPKNKHYEMSLAARNLMNEVSFQQVQTTDYSTNIFRVNILPRYFMVNIMFSF